MMTFTIPLHARHGGQQSHPEGLHINAMVLLVSLSAWIAAFAVASSVGGWAGGLLGVLTFFSVPACWVATELLHQPPRGK